MRPKTAAAGAAGVLTLILALWTSTISGKQRVLLRTLWKVLRWCNKWCCVTCILSAASGPPNCEGDSRMHAQPVHRVADRHSDILWTQIWHAGQYPKIGFLVQGPGRRGVHNTTEDIIRDRFWHRIKGKHWACLQNEAGGNPNHSILQRPHITSF